MYFCSQSFTELNNTYMSPLKVVSGYNASLGEPTNITTHYYIIQYNTPIQHSPFDFLAVPSPVHRAPCGEDHVKMGVITQYEKKAERIRIRKK